ncbi:MAG: bifunctional glutamate N-acetyltransferase/amino-acid acetyltransferase ArgJ [Gammaproteobacteria bacterium]|nr:bifunctional glutamate N-acetyltransferase/amino-acid acetyltransferase ArgJ [Gammaproteobacteria bacterium]MDH5651507.1 bifunctional glutamate N-acetyltransferase/amino-acid acetyltransferase ArgJ [Gammaproteobacteria bacterium]
MSKFPVLAGLLPIKGIRIATACAGIKKAERRDVVVFELAEGTTAAGVFTRNAFCAAPVIVARKHLHQTVPRYLLVNTGNANAGTGQPGMDAAVACCKAVAEATQCKVEQVLPFSTGVIGEPLPVNKISDAIPAALGKLDENGWGDAAYGIMTTDTVAKGLSRQFELQGKTVTITGIAKGSGMIRPDMATMLAYIATDACLAPELLHQALQSAVDESFNRITVDGDTSTNDACILMATGKSGAVIDAASSKDYQRFVEAVSALCEELAIAMVRDGEGATKFITIEVNGGHAEAECLQVAYTIAHSPLVKTAFFAGDPNWGRILAAVGRAGVHDLDVSTIEVFLGDVCITRQGGRAADYTEEQGKRVMSQTDIPIRIELHRGSASARVWTCDFSYDYVKINAEYRT